jgi:hypothetical protein
MDCEIIFGFDFWFGFGTLSPFLQFGICLQYFALVLALMGLPLFSYIISSCLVFNKDKLGLSCAKLR